MARNALLLAALVLSPQLRADTQVQFDVPSQIMAEDVTTGEFLSKHPTEKLIRISIPISTLVPTVNDPQLIQCLYLVSGSQSSPFQIIDYLPGTTLDTDVEGLVASERSSDSNSSIGVNLASPHDFPIPSSADGRLSVGSRETEKLSRLPEKRLLSASGTMHRGVSAYFKLKPSTQTTLEGSKNFIITVRVRDTWRAGMLYVNCAAYGKKCRSAKGFLVGAYLMGDQDAKQLVDRLTSSQSQLRQLAVRHAGSIEAKRFPSVGHRVGGALSMVKPKIPKQWLNRLLTSNDYHRFERHLPREIQHATTSYREARRQVTELNGQI